MTYFGLPTVLFNLGLPNLTTSDVMGSLFPEESNRRNRHIREYLYTGGVIEKPVKSLRDLQLQHTTAATGKGRNKKAAFEEQVWIDVASQRSAFLLVARAKETDDVERRNLQVFISGESGCILVQTVRHILPGEELIVGFNQL